ncbi:MAG: hypothetical protein ACFCUI_06510 [Bernardetiaceae bacterium]
MKMISTTTLDFLETDVPALLSQLTAETRPCWGLMTAQHVLEHLGGVLKLSASYREVPLLLSPEQSQSIRLMALSGKFPPNFQNPAFPSTPPPLRFASFEDAQSRFLDALQEALQYLKSKPERCTQHPLAGPFSAQDWIDFHAGHIQHHFRQFGLIPLDFP